MTINAVDFTDVDKAFNRLWLYETCHISRMITSRVKNNTDLGAMNPHMKYVRNYINKLKDKFNATQKTSTFTEFVWTKTGCEVNTDPSPDQFVASDYALFGLTVGSKSAPYKLAIICHLDTVPADDDPSIGWHPYKPTIKRVDYEDGTTDSGSQHFLIGRGCIDDKGPAISAFIAARCIAKNYDGDAFFDNVQLEVLFDTSEETDMATPHYLDDPNTVPPDFGVVYDAMWCVRAEKGGERPIFSAEAGAPAPSTEVYLSALNSSDNNSANTIPDYAIAEFKGDKEKLRRLYESIDLEYSRFQYDDPDYQRADMVRAFSDDRTSFTIKTTVLGAQHGSAPDENRADGWNPLVSLICFVSGLADDGQIAANNLTTMAKFSTEMFGTYVFGELQSPYLYRYDQIFKKDNGTTYAVTKSTTNPNGSIDLCLDIRYALGHHSVQWTGEEGLVEGPEDTQDQSIFEGIFDTLVKKFNANSGSSVQITKETTTLFAPDVRIPDTNEKYLSIEKAFEDEMGYAPNRLAIGGGTDAKGVTNLFAAGALFTPSLGPPINYHGIMEGAPIVDMKRATKIIYNLFEGQLKNPIMDDGAKERTAKDLSRLRNMRNKGYKSMCRC